MMELNKLHILQQNCGHFNKLQRQDVVAMQHLLECQDINVMIWLLEYVVCVGEISVTRFVVWFVV